MSTYSLAGGAVWGNSGPFGRYGGESGGKGLLGVLSSGAISVPFPGVSEQLHIAAATAPTASRAVPSSP